MLYDPFEHPVAETIADLIVTYIDSLLFTVVFVNMFQLQVSVSEYFAVAYFATMYIFTMKWWLSIDL